MHPYVYYSIIYNNQYMETSWVPINGWLDKEIMGYYLAIKRRKCCHLQRHRWILRVHLKMDGSYAKWNKPDRERQITCGFTCCCSVTRSCPTLCDPMDCSTPGFPVLHSLPEFAQAHVHQIGDANQLSHPLTLFSCPQIFPSIRVFSNESAFHIRWRKYWSFCFSISPSNECSGWSPLGLTGLISLLFKGLSRVFSNSVEIP